MTENEQLLKRLMTRQSTYNVIDWENERKEQIKNVRRISKYDLSISTYKRGGKSRRRGKKHVLNSISGANQGIDSKDIRAKMWQESVRNGPN